MWGCEYLWRYLQLCFGSWESEEFYCYFLYRLKSTSLRHEILTSFINTKESPSPYVWVKFSNLSYVNSCRQEWLYGSVWSSKYLPRCWNPLTLEATHVLFRCHLGVGGKSFRIHFLSRLLENNYHESDFLFSVYMSSHCNQEERLHSLGLILSFNTTLLSWFPTKISLWDTIYLYAQQRQGTHTHTHTSIHPYTYNPLTYYRGDEKYSPPKQCFRLYPQQGTRINSATSYLTPILSLAALDIIQGSHQMHGNLLHRSSKPYNFSCIHHFIPTQFSLLRKDRTENTGCRKGEKSEVALSWLPLFDGI